MNSLSSVSSLAPHARLPASPVNAGFAIVLALVSILILPGAVYFLGETSSMSAGVLLAAVLILAMRVLNMPGMRALGPFGLDLAVASLVVILLGGHLAICALRGDIDVVKALGSFVIAWIAIVACGTVGSMFRHAPDPLVRLAVIISMVIFLCSAALSLTGVQPSSNTATSKPVFPFTEPSLFAGALLPVLAFLSVTGRGWQRWAWILTAFSLGYLVENLSLVLGSIVVTVVCLTVSRLAILGAVAALLLPLLDLTYFLDRVKFNNTETTNLSSLVYIQGWEMIGSATQKTLGWGLGFQQLGHTFLDAPTSDLIYRLTGGLDLNLKEGSFAAAKLISELGVFGFGLVVVHGYFATRAFLTLRRVAIFGKVRPLGEILALCSVYTYIVEMYARGAGYFSAPTMLMVASLFLLRQSQSHTRGA
jgi:hypothetical protein